MCTKCSAYNNSYYRDIKNFFYELTITRKYFKVKPKITKYFMTNVPILKVYCCGVVDM